METVSLVIAEYGGDWLPWARELRTSKDRVVVLMQAQDESAAVFSRRVIARLDALRREGVQLGDAALVGGAQGGPGHQRHRSKVVRKLTALLSRCGPAGNLYLDPSPAWDEASGRLMHAIAWAVRDLARGSGVSISVQAAPASP